MLYMKSIKTNKHKEKTKQKTLWIISEGRVTEEKRGKEQKTDQKKNGEN